MRSGEPGEPDRDRAGATHGVPQGPSEPPSLQEPQPAAPSGPDAQAQPGARLIYADFYAPIVDLATSPDRYGFNGTDGDGALKPCSGGGRYFFNFTALCSMPGVSACVDPSATRTGTDGVHLTEARIADGWLRAPYAHPAHIKHELVA